MKKLKLIVSLLVLISLLSCSNKNNYDIAVSSSKRISEYSKLDKIIKKNYERVGKKFKAKLDTNTTFQFTNNVRHLMDSSKYDMAVITNNNYINKDTINNNHNQIRVVFPLSSRILYIAYNKEKLNPVSIEDLFVNSKVLILSNEKDFIQNILIDLGVNLKNVNFLMSKFNREDPDFLKLDQTARDSIMKLDFYGAYKKDQALPYDVEIGIIPVSFSSNNRLNKFFNSRKEFKLFSLDDYRMYKNGSSVEGFCLRNKFFTPYLLPKGTYGEFPESPVLTIRQDFILACREEVDDEFIYEFVKTAVEETDLIDLETYGKSFNNINFAFPLHEGTKRYLDKNAPKFYEKYAELLAKIGTGAGGLYTVIIGLMLWRKRRKRKGIKTDFQKVLDIQLKINRINTLDELKAMYSELQDIQGTYHTKILEQKILIDETLRIFFEVINKNEKYLLNEIRKQQSSS